MTYSNPGDDNDEPHNRPREWAPFGGASSSGGNLSMVLFIQLWCKWVKDLLGKKTGRIIILDCFMKNRKDLLEERKIGISWINGALFDSAKSLLFDDMKILHPDCPVLLSNFVKKALNDEINLERNDLIAYVNSQDEDIRRYIAKKRRGSGQQARELRKRTAKKTNEKTDDEPTPPQKRTRRKNSSGAVGHKVPNTEDVDPNVTEEESISEQIRFATMKVPNVAEFKAKATKVMLDTTSSDKDVTETFLYFKKKGLIKKIEFVSPPKAKQPNTNVTEETPPTIEDKIFEAMEFDPGSTIDKLFKETIALKPDRLGEHIVKAKLQAKARELFDVLVHTKNPMDLTTDDIKNLIKGSVSYSFGVWNSLFLVLQLTHSYRQTPVVPFTTAWTVFSGS